MADSNRFVNPYNFISLPNKKAKAYLDEDKHYGVIHYSITTKTPLFIPNSSNDNAFGCKETDHKSYDFFSYTDLSNEKNVSGKYQEPVVPGSEMRGLVRNVYETLTDSCMGVLNDDYPVKRIGAKFKPGLLHIQEDGSLSLVEAISIRIGESAKHPKEMKKFEDGDKIYFSNHEASNGRGMIRKFSKNEGSYNTCGYVIKWGLGVRKEHFHAFKASNKVVKKNMEAAAVKNMMDAIVTSYIEQPSIKSNDEDAYKSYLSSFKKFIKGDKEAYFPVNYSVVGNDIVSIAPATFSKEVSSRSLSDYAGVFAPCEEELCPACDLFGKIGDNAKGSRIRFSDMYVEKLDSNKPYYVKDFVTIDNLSSPKISNVDFYLVKPKNADFWTYDYYIES